MRDQSSSVFRSSSFMQHCMQEREEILKHKWIESEKKGYDIGYERALLDWVHHHKPALKSQRCVCAAG